MSETIVVLFLMLCLGALFGWAFRHLPAERWQVLAALPVKREASGVWRSVNLTYYGFFNSLSVAVGVIVAAFLAGSAGLPLSHIACGLLSVLAICILASKIVSKIVEGHWHGFTIGGASFVGMMIGPWIVLGVAQFGVEAGGASEAISVLAALASAYALGEGIGRLACISFGCCYGKPVTDCPYWLQSMLGRWTFVFEGRLKKASFEHGFEGQRLVPVQAMTAMISSAAGVAGIALFLGGYSVFAYIVPIIVTQVWRFVSEFLRADYRGEGRISAYQWMALIGTVYTIVLGLLWPSVPNLVPDVARGLALLWTPEAILIIEVIALLVFVRMGVSSVTMSRVALDLTENDAIPPQASGKQRGPR